MRSDNDLRWILSRLPAMTKCLARTSSPPIFERQAAKFHASPSMLIICLWTGIAGRETCSCWAAIQHLGWLASFRAQRRNLRHTTAAIFSETFCILCCHEDDLRSFGLHPIPKVRRNREVLAVWLVRPCLFTPSTHDSQHSVIKLSLTFLLLVGCEGPRLAT